MLCLDKALGDVQSGGFCIIWETINGQSQAQEWGKIQTRLLSCQAPRNARQQITQHTPVGAEQLLQARLTKVDLAERGADWDTFVMRASEQSQCMDDQQPTLRFFWAKPGFWRGGPSRPTGPTRRRCRTAFRTPRLMPTA